MHVSFLSANVALTKSFTKQSDGTISKEPYPFVGNFTSSTYEVNTPLELNKLITAHSIKGDCLLKGRMLRDINNESRKGMTTTDEATEWICLDFDRLKAESVNDELQKLGIHDVTHTIQWSSSQGLPGTDGTISCHVFMMLDREVMAPELKLWLKHLNFAHYAADIRLSRHHAAISWPLDVTTCQNDKLLYIATPKFNNMPDPLKGARIEFVKRKLDRLPAERMPQSSPEVLRTKEQAKKNELRVAIGLKAVRSGTTFIGEHEVQNKPGEASVTGIKDCGDFVRINLNGGDSWAYWHPKVNFELLFNFKGEPAYRLKEICPSYYADLVSKANAAISTPTAGGEIVLGFRDFVSAKYHNGTWEPETKTLTLSEARSEKQIEHYYMSHGLTPPSFIPIWTMTYDPQNETIVDADRNWINMFQPSPYMIEASERKVNLEKECPTIKMVVSHMLGDDPAVIKAFEEWFACIFKLRRKPLVAWVAHGVEGTGKGTWFDLIAVPLLGRNNTIKVDINAVEDKFNGFMKNKLLIMVDEIDHEDFKEKGRATAIFKNRITEPTFPCRDMRSSTYEYPNCFALFFASNRPQPVYIGASDRRHNVARFQKEKLVITERERKQIQSELMAYADHLLSVKTDVTIASTILDTHDRREIAKRGVSASQDVANMLLNGEFIKLWGMLPDEKHMAEINQMNEDLAYASAYSSLIKGIARAILNGEFKQKISRDEMYTIFRYATGKGIKASPNSFTAFVGHLGISIKTVRRGKETFQGMELKWDVADEDLGLIREVMDKPTKLRAIK